MADISDQLIDMPMKSYAKKPVTGIARTKTVKQKKVTMTTKDQFKKAKSTHKAEIAKLKHEIKRQKMLIKQAKLAYKINKMEGVK